MKEIIKSDEIPTFEAEIIGNKNKGEENFNYKSENYFRGRNKNFFIKIIESTKNSILKFLFLISFSFIFIGILLSFTIIGSIIGIPLIIFGIIILFITFKLLIKN